ncbi:MAG: type II toxin-antitoxin system YafQ family toxin [Endomicrobium sp.]|jgi:mRNA interferase YafQ|nr:type II toxin-antitoxin system YafQ family toxin [Endomicrobium sp.]
MLEIKRSATFKTGVKKIRDRKILDELKIVLTFLIDGEELPLKYQLHSLKGKFKDYRDCHITPDTILLFRVVENTLYLYKIGNHNTLFK